MLSEFVNMQKLVFVKRPQLEKNFHQDNAPVIRYHGDQNQ